MKRKYSVIFFMCCILAFSGCATVTDPVHVKRNENDKSFKNVVTGKKVLIMQPFITAVTTNTEAPVSSESCGAVALANLLENHAKSACQEARSSTAIFQKDMPQNAAANEALKALADKSHILMSYYKNKSELMTSLQTIANATGAEIVSACSIMVKVGGRGGWNPNTGQIWQGTSSTTMKAVLISTATGKVLWGNEIFVRAVASDKQCIDAAEKMFADINETGGDVK
jgi:hypothetical protein